MIARLLASSSCYDKNHFIAGGVMNEWRFERAEFREFLRRQTHRQLMSLRVCMCMDTKRCLCGIDVV